VRHKEFARDRLEQQILVMDRSAVSDMFGPPYFVWNPFLVDHVIDRVSEGRHVSRTEAEASSDLVQVIGCSIVRKGDRALCLRRSSTSGVELRNRYTVLFGGHVEQADSPTVEGVTQCVTREVKEELGVEPVKTPEVIGVVADSRNATGRRHLGVVFDFECDTDSVDLREAVDVTEFATDDVVHEMKTLDEIEELRDQLDPWSMLVVDSVAMQARLRPRSD
jgi:predicted NUDIX family phosphoesterase